MATTTENIASVTESALELITGIQQRIVDANKEVAATVAGLVPDVPSWVPTADLPDTSAAASIVEEGFAFQTRLIEANKAFSLGLLAAWAPAAPKPAAPKAANRVKATATKKSA